MTLTSRQQVELIRSEDPDATASEMARAIGVSRERIRQLLVDLGLPTTTSRTLSGGMGRGRPQGTPSDSRTTGTLAEILSAHDLAAKGWHVYWPLQHTPLCDLVIVARAGGRALKVEVKSGRRVNGILEYSKARLDYGNHDVLVVVTRTGEIHYDPEPYDLL